MTNRSALLGSWEITSWKREVVETGEKIDALRGGPGGVVGYGADGRFYALIVAKDRPKPAGMRPSDQDKLRLFESMLAYAGTFSVFDDRVVHHVDVSWNQTWTGTDQVRFYKLVGETLSLTGAPAPDPYTGAQVVHQIEFRKMAPSG